MKRCLYVGDVELVWLYLISLIKNMVIPILEQWEEQFNKKFSKVQHPNWWFKDEQYNDSIHVREVKDFIRSLLSSAAREREEALAKQRLDIFEALHAIYMETGDLKVLDAIEKAQKIVLSGVQSNTKR